VPSHREMSTTVEYGGSYEYTTSFAVSKYRPHAFKLSENGVVDDRCCIGSAEITRGSAYVFPHDEHMSLSSVVTLIFKYTLCMETSALLRKKFTWKVASPSISGSSIGETTTAWGIAQLEVVNVSELTSTAPSVWSGTVTVTSTSVVG